MLLNKNTISLFVDDALRTASILKNHASSIYSNSKERYLHGFEHRELYVRPLSFEKNAVDCTSQRLKWTSGA